MDKEKVIALVESIDSESSKARLLSARLHDLAVVSSVPYDEDVIEECQLLSEMVVEHVDKVKIHFSELRELIG